MTLSRRRLLQAGAAGLLSVPGLVAASAGGTKDGHAAAKSCIFVLLCGGPSHLDTWDLKSRPGLPPWAIDGRPFGACLQPRRGDRQ
ncbi:MAG: DUF1501 domain-containing protein [Gemmataceae bacterium]|nr:DUF1501 domain-containing protein [Gemmataceae bacterium]